MKRKDSLFIFLFFKQNKLKSIPKKEEFEEIIEAAEESEEEAEEKDPADEEFIKTVFSDDDSVNISETEKREKGFD